MVNSVSGWMNGWIYICCPDWPQTPMSVTFLPQKIIKVLLGYGANIYNRMPIIILKFSRNSLYSKPASLIPFLHTADNNNNNDNNNKKSLSCGEMSFLSKIKSLKREETRHLSKLNVSSEQNNWKPPFPLFLQKLTFVTFETFEKEPNLSNHFAGLN